MLINDLSHLEILGQSPAILGGLDDLVLTLDDRELVLTLGSELLFETTLPMRPTSFSLSVSGVPGIAVSSRAQTINGVSESSVSVRVLGSSS